MSRNSHTHRNKAGSAGVGGPTLHIGQFHLIRGTPLWMTDLFAYPGTKFCLDTPRTESSLQRITENLLKFTREYGDILACQYPLGQTLKNHP